MWALGWLKRTSGPKSQVLSKTEPNWVADFYGHVALRIQQLNLLVVSLQVLHSCKENSAPPTFPLPKKEFHQPGSLLRGTRTQGSECCCHLVDAEALNFQHDRAAVAGGNFRSLRSLVVVTKKRQAGFSAEGCTKVDTGNLQNRKACLAGDRSWSPTWHSNTQ
ncbi:hypothetical protein SLEP1_g48932 [Rubroshorea leprosula]|uniref:Uncharacterized protein n=1 Tax=Rubroshorea leprosula TaxID=152421 RepID=A0AAV5LV72_9ROSI|nr:hypothetical protein SLEP1_g48932 [Rubroshorea leprosula]